MIWQVEMIVSAIVERQRIRCTTAARKIFCKCGNARSRFDATNSVERRKHERCFFVGDGFCSTVAEQWFDRIAAHLEAGNPAAKIIGACAD